MDGWIEQVQTHKQNQRRKAGGQRLAILAYLFHKFMCEVIPPTHTSTHLRTQYPEYKEAVKAYKEAVDAERKSRATDLMPKKKVHIQDAMLLTERQLACV